MNSNKFTIKKIDEIKVSALKDKEIHKEIADKLLEIEEVIADAISENKTAAIVEIGFQDYVFVNFSSKTAAQIISFYIIETLRENKYTVDFTRSSDAICIRIKLDSKSSLEKQLDSYFKF